MPVAFPRRFYVASGKHKLRLRQNLYRVSSEISPYIAISNTTNAGQHKNRGKSAVEEALRLQKSQDAAQAHVDDLHKRIVDISSEAWEVATAELELETALHVLKSAQGRVQKKERALGVAAKEELRKLIKSPFLAKKMNARALKTQIRERLRSRKFELDRLERSYHKQRSGKL